jgi:hypothetical protein
MNRSITLLWNRFGFELALDGTENGLDPVDATPAVDPVGGGLFLLWDNACWEVQEVVPFDSPPVEGASWWHCVECYPPPDPILPLATLEAVGTEEGGAK